MNTGDSFLIQNCSNDVIYYIVSENQPTVNVAGILMPYQQLAFRKIDGDLYCCGYNTNCSQGISATTTSTKTFARRAKNVSAVLAGTSYTFYIDNENKLYACGANVNGLSSSTSNVTSSFTLQAENVKTIVNRTMYIDCNNTL